MLNHRLFNVPFNVGQNGRQPYKTNTCHVSRLFQARGFNLTFTDQLVKMRPAQSGVGASALGW
jgi:hypothetical protein